MPEGDTIWRLAGRLRPALAGRALLGFEAPRLQGPQPARGARIEAVEAAGKHLLVHFDDGVTLASHLQMNGAWHLYQPGQRWRLPRHLMRCRLVVEGAEAVCFKAPSVRTYRRSVDGSAPATDPVAGLGPDLIVDGVDIDEVLGRIAAVDTSTIVADVLLDQKVAAGVGNVFKSEVLFACSVHPATPIGEVDGPTRRRLVETAVRMLRANRRPGPRTTALGPPGTVAVYRRARQPCRRCGTLVVKAAMGIHQRSTYWCPRCQRR